VLRTTYHIIKVDKKLYRNTVVPKISCLTDNYCFIIHRSKLYNIDRTGLGFGTPSIVQRREKRFVSPDNKHNLLITEQSGPSKRRKTAILTPDNAESVLGNAFDLATFAEAAKNPDVVQDQTMPYSTCVS